MANILSIYPLSASTGGSWNAKTEIKLIVLACTVQAFSVCLIVTSAGDTHIVANIVNYELSGLTNHLDNAFSGVIQVISCYTASTCAVSRVGGVAELVWLTVSVESQVLSGWAWGWVQVLKTLAGRVWSVAGNTCQAKATLVINHTQSANLFAVSVHVWDESIWALNLNADSVGQLESKDARQALSSNKLES
jgi:hypothetical protein